MRTTNKKAQMEAALAKLQRELDALQNSAAYKKEQAFKKAVEALLKRHGRSKADLIEILAGDVPLLKKASKVPSKTAKKTPKKRKARKLKVYKNPKTGEVIETRGGNHTTLKAWKAKYKMDNLEAWVVEEKA